MKVINFSQKYLSTKDVSEILDVSEITIKRYLRDGKLPSFKFGNVRRIKAEDVKRLFKKSITQTQTTRSTDLKIIPGYMGIKTQILSHIHLEINKIAKKGEVVLDIFAGSGVVGYELKRDFIVYSNDVEPYSCVVNKLLIDNTLSRADIEKFDIASLNKNYEKNLLALAKEEPFNLDKYNKNHSLFPYSLFTAYFSNTYFGAEQAKQIDSLRYAIEHADPKYKNLLLSCLIFSCYNTVTSVGSHFAQPKIAKAKNKVDIEKKRALSIKECFEKKFKDIETNLYVDSKKTKVFCLNFVDLLSSTNTEGLGKISVTYIDPPYTIDHYSRFYHILNTLVLYDYPDNIGKGQYRSDRYQSKFSIKSTAREEFDTLIKKLAGLGSKVVMSYSDGYRSLLSIEEILEVLKKYYKARSIKTPIKIEYNYSGFGRSAFNRANELLFVAIDPK